jgi:hypothetical protein
MDEFMMGDDALDCEDLGVSCDVEPEDEGLDEFLDEFFDRLDEIDESMDGDFDSAMTSAGFGTDEDYGMFDGGEW